MTKEIKTIESTVKTFEQVKPEWRKYISRWKSYP